MTGTKNALKDETVNENMGQRKHGQKRKPTRHNRRQFEKKFSGGQGQESAPLATTSSVDIKIMAEN